ncbi:MAG: hypothetical protein IKN81_00525 [Oscillospiraceae bacterium]|nr:hypothetical protein [Oscillospiraceae bacterium]
MSGIYERSLLLGSEHVDCFRRLRTSTLFTLLQTASIRHTEELGMGREKTLDRGLLWIVARQFVVIDRMPVYDERVTLRTWPGETMRVLFPRYYEILSERGETLVRGSAVWSLMDAETRTAAFPDEYGVEIAGVETGRELPFLTKLSASETPHAFDFAVPYSYVDLNGHMNNTRYFDLIEDHLPAAKSGKLLREIHTEYTAEAKLGAALHVAWGEAGGQYYVNGSSEHICFRMSLRYEENCNA